MPEIYRVIINRRGKPGRTERFVSIEVHVSDEPVDVNWDLLDKTGKRDLRENAKDTEYRAVAGVANIAWKSEKDRADCIADHGEKRQRRWNRMEEIKERMKAGEFPQFAHAYLHPSLTRAEDLMVIDGTRRMLAYLELGRSEMPVIVFRAVSHDRRGWPDDFPEQTGDRDGSPE